MTLIYLVAAWAAGIFLASFTNASAAFWLSLAAGALCLAIFARREPAWRITALCIILLSLGAARQAWAARPLPRDHIAHYVDTGYITLTGVIDQMPDIREQHVNLRIDAESLRTDQDAQAAAGKVLVQAPRYGGYEYGDRVRVSGTLLTPPEFDGFSYRDYLARRGIHAMIPNARVEILVQDQGQPWYAVMYDLKSRAQQTIDRLLPSPQAPLLSGILLGVETSISDDVRDAFNRTGTSHVIAISGANIIVVIGILIGLLKPALGIRRASLVTLIGVAVYTMFVGADAAVVRAAIMGTITLIAAQVGRQAYSPRVRTTYGLTALALSIWLMTAYNPMTLWDIGFQLSVAATAGLVLFGHTFNTLLESLLKRGFTSNTAKQVTRVLSEPITVSVAAQITTTPLILLYFGRFSVISLAANILIVPVQAYIMTIGGLATILGIIWLPAGEVFAWFVWLPLSYTIEIVRALSAFDFASTEIELTSSSAWAVYSVLLLLAFLLRMHPEDRLTVLHGLRHRLTTGLVITLGIAITMLVWFAAFSQPDLKLHVWFLDIGHGHAVLIQTPNGAQILVDGGPNPSQLRRAIGDELPFWDRSLDLLIVTQPRRSAIGALPALLDRYDISRVLTNGQLVDSDDYEALRRAWEQHSVEVNHVVAGYRIETGDHVTLEFLHPQTHPTIDDKPDQTALVIRVSYGDAVFLITPVLEESALDTMFNAGRYAGSTVLELPNYGEMELNTEEFLARVSPQVGVVEVGAGNRSGLPDSETVERLHALTGQTLYRTDRHGTIEMVTDGHTLWIYPER